MNAVNLLRDLAGAFAFIALMAASLMAAEILGMIGGML